MNKLFVTLIISSMVFCANLLANVILVPTSQPTIQAGIDVAITGDTVLVWEGTYPERINFKGKDITVASQYIIDLDTSHITNTIIDGDTALTLMVDDTGSVVRFVSGETAAAVLVGFTVTNGVGTLGKGGGIFLDWLSSFNT